MPPPLTILVTRPEEAGRELVEALRRPGIAARWWPAFELLPPSDPVSTGRRLAAIATDDLLVFVSPAAVRFAAPALPSNWPQGTQVAAVGAATRERVLALLPQLDPERIVCAEPAAGAAGGAAATAEGADAGGAAAGSEGLFARLVADGLDRGRVLLLRAQAGRDWLGQQLSARGARVEALEVYRRCPVQPSSAACAELAAALGTGAVAVVVTSSEAVGVLDAQVRSQPALARRLREGRALASHPRIAAALRAAGYRDVAECAPSADGILAALASRDTPSGPNTRPDAGPGN